MALIRFGEGSQRSGALGGVVFSRNRFGPYVRARSVPVQPQTALQVAVRVAMSDLSEAWEYTLTQDQRDQWDWYGSNTEWVGPLGEPHKLTGKMHYLRSNVPRILVGLDQIDDGPIYTGLPAGDTQFTLSGSVATQQLTATFRSTSTWVGRDGAGLLIYMGVPKNASVKFFNGPWRFAHLIEGDSGSPPTSPVAAIAVPWPVGLGQHIWGYSRVSREDGRLSEPVRCDFFCAA
jgi:hypothetical protein